MTWEPASKRLQVVTTVGPDYSVNYTEGLSELRDMVPAARRFAPEAVSRPLRDAFAGINPRPLAPTNLSALLCLYASPGNTDFAPANFIGLGPALAPPSRRQRQGKC